MLQPRPPFPSGVMDLILGRTETDGALFLSGIEAAINTNLLQQNQIGAILTIGTEMMNLKFTCQHKLFLLHDTAFDPIKSHFEEAIKFIEEQRKLKNNVLVHCYVGVSRSATIVIAYLMQMYNYSLQGALTFLTSRRPHINPNPGFLQQLQIFETDLQRKRQIRPASTSYAKSPIIERTRRETVEVKTNRLMPNSSPLKFIKEKAFSTKSLYLTPKRGEQQKFNFTTSLRTAHSVKSMINLDSTALRQSNYFATHKRQMDSLNGIKTATNFCKSFNQIPFQQTTQQSLKRTTGSGLGHNRGRQPVRAIEQSKI